jgi:DNA primase
MPRSPSVDTAALRRAQPLPEVVTSYGLVLHRAGPRTFQALCPFHQEHTPSFWIDARVAGDEHYHCFGCTAHGDVITFVMTHEGVTFPEACTRLGARPRPGPVAVAAGRREAARGRRWESLGPDDPAGELLEQVLAVYEQSLTASARAQAYLASRGIPSQVVARHRLGYAGGRTLIAELTQASADPARLAVAIELGLLLARPLGVGGPPYREFFTDRLMVPELRGGRPIWLVGRAVEPPSPGSRPRPKYLGLAGEKPLLGLDRVATQPRVYIVEGPFDFLAASGWDLPACAVGGTHFPPERLPAFAEAQAVYGVFDPDRAGQSAAARLAPLFGSRWRQIRLPNQLDLADLARLGEPGRDAFLTLVGQARAAAWQRLHGS